MYYGFRCYLKEGQPIGWLYTYNNDGEIAFSNRELDGCKRWKTKKGAENNFEYYNNRWQFKTKGGYLKIEVMPETPESEPPKKSHHLTPLAQQEDEPKPNAWTFQPTPENLEWLEEERQENEDGNLESDEALLNRKLEKLRKLEQQGF